MNAFRFHSINHPTRRQFDEALDDFAECLSRDMPLNDIASVMTISRGTACVLLRMVCERLGGQAR